MTKKVLYPRIEAQFQKLTKDQILDILFDFFDIATLHELSDHLSKELGEEIEDEE